MKYALMLFTLITMSSCGIYNYNYNSQKNAIVSKNWKSISEIIITQEGKNRRAHFIAIEGQKSRSFSLHDFSPADFECISGCPSFKLEQNNIYYIHAFPKGDRMRLPIKIKVQSDGTIINLEPDKAGLLELF